MQKKQKTQKSRKQKFLENIKIFLKKAKNAKKRKKRKKMSLDTNIALACFLRITEEVFVSMILDAVFKMNEMIMKCIFNQQPKLYNLRSLSFFLILKHRVQWYPVFLNIII